MNILIIGGGQVGAYLGTLLQKNGHEIKIIESREETFKKLKAEFAEKHLLFADGTDPKILEKNGIASVDVVAAVTGADETNLLVSTLSKMEFGVSKVIARVNNPKNAWLFNSGMGVDIGVNQADIIGHFIMREMHIEDASN